MKTAKLLATNTLAQLVGKAATIGSTLLIGRMISSPDGIGKAGFDEYAIIVAYAAYFYIVTDFGFNAIAAQKVTEDESQASRYISNLLSMRLVLSVGLIMVALAALAFISYSTTVKLGILILLVTIATQAIFTNGNILFQAKLRYVQSTIAVVSGAATSLALAYLVFIAGGNIFGYLVAIVIGSATMAAVSLFQVGSAVKIRPAFDFTLWRHVVLAALPLGLTIVF